MESRKGIAIIFGVALALMLLVLALLARSDLPPAREVRAAPPGAPRLVSPPRRFQAQLQLPSRDLLAPWVQPAAPMQSEADSLRAWTAIFLERIEAQRELQRRRRALADAALAQPW